MRIALDDGKGRRRKKTDKRGARQRRSQTFDAAITQPQIQLGTGREKKIPVSRRDDVAATVPTPALRLPPLAPALAAITWPLAWRRLPAVLLLAMLLGGILFALLDSRFYVYKADIAGAHHLGTAAVFQAAGIDELHILWLRPEDVQGNVMLLGGIKSVDVRVGLPAAVSIEIEERDPVVLWRALSQTRDWWIDEEGVVLPYHGDAHSDEVVFVIDSSQRPLQVGETLEPAGVVASALRLASALPGTRLFYFDEDRGLSFTQDLPAGKWPVYVGDSDDLARKIQVLQALNNYLEKEKIQPRYVDIRWADRPVYGKPTGASNKGSQ